ncbi:MAG TPA: type VI secretion system tip protein TssI/VgrG [Caulobacteraceae bacterium]|jgi:type VI secretion system secreted protein VgrG
MSDSSKPDFWVRFTDKVGGNDLAVDAVKAVERLSDPFTIEIDVTSTKAIDFMPLLGLGVGLQMTSSMQMIDRTFHGVLYEVEALGRAREFYSYRLTLRPWLSLLDMGGNLRIFSKQSAQEIIKSIFDSAGFSTAYDIEATTAGKDVREYCVQFKESDFDFVSRLMEEEGIYYYFAHAKNKHTMVLCDAPSCHSPFPVDLQVMRGGEGDQEGAWLKSWERTVQPAIGKATLRDSHFQMPGQTLEAKAEKPASGQKDKMPNTELYEYPGGHGYINDDGSLKGDRYAKVRLEEARADCDTLSGETFVFGISVGQKIKVKEEPGAASYGAGEFLVVEAIHSVDTQSDAGATGSDQSFGFNVELEAAPAAVNWRPPRDTPKPVTGGPQTATVIGVKDKVIDVDQFGRVLVHFDWDRGQVADTTGGDAPPAAPSTDISANHTCWLRVSQGWADKGFGSMHIPRVGEEVLVDFLDGDPDRPIITGRVYNSKNTVPYTLPDEKTKSTWKSQTVGDSGTYDESEQTPPKPGYNELRFEDKGGAEEFYVHAQRIFNSMIRFDETRVTGRDTTVRVGRNRTVNIKKNETVTIETGDETRTIQKGSRTTEIEQNETLTLNSGNETRTIKTGNRTTEIEGNDGLTLKTGNSSTDVKTGNYSLNVDLGSATIEAMQKITLKVGTSTIELTPTGIDIKAMMINVQAQVQLSTKALLQQQNADALMQIKGAITMIN